MFPRFTSLTPTPPYTPQTTQSIHHINHTQHNPELQQKVNTIARLNLKPTELDICPCQTCIYQHQRPTKGSIGLDMSKNTMNRINYSLNHSTIQNSGKATLMNQQQIHRNQRKINQIVDSSNYRNQYKQPQTVAIQKYRPKDEISFKGPTSNTSSYLSSYPAFKNNQSPYVRVKEEYVMSPRRVSGVSSYRRQFKGEGVVVERSRPRDQLKSMDVWIGGSTYRRLFGASGEKNKKDDKQSSHNKHSTIQSKLPTNIEPQSAPTSNPPQLPQSLPTPPTSKTRIVKDRYNLDDSLADPNNYKHQYETIYRNDYMSGRKKCGKNSGEYNPLLASLSLM